ncbi:TIGR02444 family protein [Pelagibius sp. Alg239-R121]|uniref:TIGR02444 family protein n=1 Tax=Pelagibius sp. Alg239-R121 TaxID=2993448 RepID=UPI0024A753BF|nr:TIGR02444 family protein [Pelagibius sp. Alg239-R121]
MTSTKKKAAEAESGDAQVPQSKSETKNGKAKRASKQPVNPFWDFSLAVYERAGTAPACLALQDSKNLDVNLLLFCCWAGSLGHALKPAEIASLTKAVKPWQADVVSPLRALRRQLHSGGDYEGSSAALLGKIKDAELEAEAVQQQMLFEVLPLETGEASAKIAAENLKTYAKLVKVECDSAVTADLAAVLRGAFPLLAPLEAVWTLI